MSPAWHSQGCSRRPNAPSRLTTAGRSHSSTLPAPPTMPPPEPQPLRGSPSLSTSLALAQLPHGVSDQSPLLKVCRPIQLQEEAEVSITPLPPARGPLAFPQEPGGGRGTILSRTSSSSILFSSSMFSLLLLSVSLTWAFSMPLGSSGSSLGAWGCSTTSGSIYKDSTVRLSPCQLSQLPPAMLLRVQAPHRPDTCPVPRAVGTLEKTCHVWRKSSQPVGRCGHLRRPRQAGEHDIPPCSTPCPGRAWQPLTCSRSACQNVPKYSPLPITTGCQGPPAGRGCPGAPGWAVPAAQQQARCWQGQCAPLAAQGISRELRDLAERRACAGDQEPPPHPCSGSRPARPPPEQSQDAKSLSARPPSNAQQAAGQARNRAWRQQRGGAGVGPEQPCHTPGPILRPAAPAQHPAHGKAAGGR